MEIEGKLFQIMPLQSGEGRNGIWKKQEFVIETVGQYPKKVCFSIWGDKADAFTFAKGDQLKINFDVESREYNGRWYTDAKAWRVDPAGPSVTTSESAAPFPDNPPPEGGDDLPF